MIGILGKLRWEFISDAEDQKNGRCAGFYDEVRERYGPSARRPAAQ
jgi:hypothetical protein